MRLPSPLCPMEMENKNQTGYLDNCFRAACKVTLTIQALTDNPASSAASRTIAWCSALIKRKFLNR